MNRNWTRVIKDIAAQTLDIPVPVDAVRPFVKFPVGGEPIEGGSGVLWLTDQSVHALAAMEDSDVFNAASGRRERTWETGDVMEIFIHPDASQKPYYEFHVTPSGAALSLRIPDAVKLRADVYAFEDTIVESEFRFQSGPLRDPTAGWWGYAEIDCSEIGLTNPATAMGCICRYNYNRTAGEPEQTATADFKGDAQFHTPERWHPVRATAQNRR